MLRRRFPRLRGQHPDEWCYTTTDLHSLTRSAIAECDLVLLAGHGRSPASVIATAEAAQAVCRCTPLPR
ncbi:hypothetical protein GXW82_04165 [Streptacidiphilus sp. 4-A2]|nr:hypothetical protein [Streptacidiphilus sp. 4-A2]